MKISEKQILSLMRLAEGYSAMLDRFGEYKAADNIQDILLAINNQQSDELKEIE